MAKGFACRDCRLCTGNVFTGTGRGMGRATADVMTFGVAHLVRKTCKGCSHPMSEHIGQSAEAVAPLGMNWSTGQASSGQPQQPPKAATTWAPPPSWRPDPTDSRALCWWDGQRWHPETKHYK